MRAIMITTLATGLTLTGCATNPQTGQAEMNKAAWGGLIGAAAGAALAHAAGDKDDTVKNAAIGAALGAGVGYYMDRQERQMREKMRGTGVDVKRDPKTGSLDLVMPGNITFAFNSSNISPQFTSTLDTVVKSVREFDKTTLVVKGYTDNVGGAAYNQKLSEKRAYSVASYLANRGVTPQRIKTRGYGMSNPVASNNTDAGRAQNRRVEIVILPPKSV